MSREKIARNTNGNSAGVKGKPAEKRVTAGMIYKSKENIFREKSVPLPDGGSFPVLCFTAWENLEGVRHCFSTRAGGVSEGYLASLNFRRELYDPDENILENFSRVARFFETTPDRIVCAQQTHTSNVRIVTEEDAGKGVTRPRDYTDVDGLITNVPGLVLYTSHADCVPVFFYDPVQKVIAISHSGWKGTVSRIGAVTIRMMKEHFGCDPKNIYAAIGPSICADCYEVSEDVAEEFMKCFSVPDGTAAASGEPGGSAATELSRKDGTESSGGSTVTELIRKDAAESTGGSAATESSGRFAITELSRKDATESSGGSAADRDFADKDAAVKEGTVAENREVIPRILRHGKKPGKYQLDLWQANVRILTEAGIAPDHITVTNLCTCENKNELFSHRATGGKRGNQGAFMMLENA